MPQEFIKKIQKNKWEIIALVAIVGLGAFFRFYHFSKWLHFELDQAYDTVVVERALEHSLSYLPLLGPSIGSGQALRLPPAYYYLEYISALVFGNTPTGHALLVPILGTLSILAAYFFLRRYFRIPITLLLGVLWSISLYLVLYGRFSWNPNVLPFFLPLSFYALLRSVSRDEKYASRWFLIATAGLTFASQLHINTFFILPAVVFCFLLYTRPRFVWKTWLATFAIIFVLYLPLVINEVRGGGNAAVFQERFTIDTTTKERNWHIDQKASQAVQYVASNYFLILTGDDRVNGAKLTDYGFDSKKDNAWRVKALAMLVVLISLLWFRFWKERDQDRKNFLFLIGVWAILSTLYFFALRLDSFNIYPRFFLAVIVIPFVLLGLLFDELVRFHKVGWVAVGILFLFLSHHNAQMIKAYYYNLQYVTANPPQKVFLSDVLPYTNRMTLEQQEMVTDYIYQTWQAGGKKPLFLRSHRELDPVIWYHLDTKGVPYSGDAQKNLYFRNADYFALQFTTDSRPLLFGSNVSVLEEKSFGAITVWHIVPKEGFVENEQATLESKIRVEKAEIETFQTWHSLFTRDRKSEVHLENISVDGDEKVIQDEDHPESDAIE